MQTTKEQWEGWASDLKLFDCLKLDGDDSRAILADLERAERMELALRKIDGFITDAWPLGNFDIAIVQGIAQASLGESTQ